jgi:hypothetical protein
MVVASELGRVRRNGRSPQGCQPRGLVAVRETGLMWANMLRAFQVGKALTSDGAPSSWMRPSRMAWAQVSGGIGPGDLIFRVRSRSFGRPPSSFYRSPVPRPSRGV